MVKEQTLLQKAKSIKPNKRKSTFTKEEMDLTMAWVNDEIGITQVMKVLNTSSGMSYVFLARCTKHILNEK